MSKIGKHDQIDIEALEEDLRESSVKRDRSPEEMRWCPECRGRLKLVPGGTSKRTGSHYEAFWSCWNQGCGYTEKD